jgi:hypothetical protein
MSKSCVLPLTYCCTPVGIVKKTLVVATRYEASHLNPCNYLLFLCPKRHANDKNNQSTATIAPCLYLGSTNNPGFMLILQSFATQPESWR